MSGWLGGMTWKVCMQTPAGEYFTEIFETGELAEYTLLSALKTAMHHAEAWLEGHIDWSAGPPTMKKPVSGPGDWHIRLHPQARSCPLCEVKAPEAKAPVAPAARAPARAHVHPVKAK